MTRKKTPATAPYTREQLIALMEKQRAEQGLPPRIKDPAAFRAIARLLESRQ